jgi:hypothetical protein
VKLGCPVTIVKKVHNISGNMREECDARHWNSLILAGSACVTTDMRTRIRARDPDAFAELYDECALSNTSKH